jgi:ubiquinone/menaquinone biosynthesis C-methylase UbiE
MRWWRPLMNASTAYLPRVLEPEVMDTPEEVRDYDAMNHDEVNARFCDDLLSEGDIGTTILDVGTATARIPIEICRRAPAIRIVAIDLATLMLDRARENVANAKLEGRIAVEKSDAKALHFEGESFSTTISNSIVHHIAEPAVLLSEMLRVTTAGGLVFVRDLARPRTAAEVDRLVALYAGEPPSERSHLESFERQRALFHASLNAALTLSEVESLARKVGMTDSSTSVRSTSDRHWTLVFRKRH